jgi:hypothetical protein
MSRQSSANVATAPAKIDHLATALLAYIDGAGDTPAALAAARAILGRKDGPLMHEKGGIFEAVTARSTESYRSAQTDSEARMLAAILSYGADDLPSTDSAVAFDVLVRVVCNSVTIGAAIMYELTREGVR